MNDVCLKNIEIIIKQRFMCNVGYFFVDVVTEFLLLLCGVSFFSFCSLLIFNSYPHTQLKSYNISVFAGCQYITVYCCWAYFRVFSLDSLLSCMFLFSGGFLFTLFFHQKKEKRCCSTKFTPFKTITEFLLRLKTIKMTQINTNERPSEWV